MHEKCTSTLPPIRVPQSLELDLCRLAAQHDRKFSDYVRWALALHVKGHGYMLDAGCEDGNEDRAGLCDARHCEGRGR